MSDIQDWLAYALHEHFALEAIGPIRCGHSVDEPEIHVAEFVREQLRTDEAIERVAVALFGEETELDWEHAAQWVRDDYALFARRAITALLGEDQ